MNTVAGVLSPPLDIAVYNDRVYWIDIAGALSAVPVAGATPEVLATGFGNRNLGGLAVDDSNVYFTESCDSPDASCPYVGVATPAAAGTGRLLSVPLAGGAVTTLADQQLNPASVIVDAGNIYWINAGTSGKDTPNPDGSILMMSKSGGPPSVLVSSEPAPRLLRLEGTALYWISGSRLGEQPTAIRKLTALGTASNIGPLGGGQVFALTLDATQMYLGTLDAILSAPN